MAKKKASASHPNALTPGPGVTAPESELPEAAATGADSKPPEPPEAAQTAPQFPEGHRTYLYSKDAPKGKLFVGSAANEALEKGWVDSPAKL